MPLLTIADSFYIGVLDVESATSWYIEKLGLQKVPAEMDDPEGLSRWASPKGSNLHRRPRTSKQADYWNDAHAVRLQHQEGERSLRF